MLEVKRKPNNARLVILIVLLIVSVVFFLTGCKRLGLHHDLSEEEANEILVLLNQNEIKATKIKEVRQNETFWIIEVHSDDVMRARVLLQQNDLPSRKAAGLEEVYKEKGLIPTPDEQKARYLLALKGEIINSLEKIPEIIDVDVVLNVPDREEFAEPGTPQKRPSAAAVIKARQPLGGGSPLSEMKIQKFIANAIENLDPRDVTVIISYSGKTNAFKKGDWSETFVPLGEIKENEEIEKEKIEKESGKKTTILGISVDVESKKRVKIYLLVFFGLLVLLSAGLIVMILRTSRMRKKKGSGPEDDSRLLEGNVIEDGSPRLEAPDEFEE
ncbi:hypothetical protein KKA47_07405 [bacterium]|nr:hypothetical protein [bacterium]